MLYMENWRLSAPVNYSLGFEGDNLAEELVVSTDLNEEWDLKVDVERGGEKNIIQLERHGTTYSAVLTAGMLGEDGVYGLQIRGTLGEKVCHSNIVPAIVYRSVNAVQAFPDPLPSEFEQMERRLTALNQHPPVPGEDGVWLVWNGEREAYEPSQIPLPTGIISGNISLIRVLELAEYEALAEKDPATLYLIRG